MEQGANPLTHNDHDTKQHMKFTMRKFLLCIGLVANALLLIGCNEAPKRPDTQRKELSVPHQDWKPFSGEPLPALDTGTKITTWNLQWFPGWKPGQAPAEQEEQHITGVIGVLKGINPDILCLQEVKQSDKHTQTLERIAKEIWPKVEGSVQVISNFKGSLEVAILSRHKADAAFMEEFEEADASPPRGFAYSAFKFGDHVVATYTVHLKSNWGGVLQNAPKREEGARQLIEHAKGQEKHYKEQGLSCTVMLCGDYNYDPGSPKWAKDKTFDIFLNDGFKWSGIGLPRNQVIAWLANKRFPDAAFDHVLFRAAEGVAVSRSWTTEIPPGVSDHRPVSVMIKIPEK